MAFRSPASNSVLRKADRGAVPLGGSRLLNHHLDKGEKRRRDRQAERLAIGHDYTDVAPMDGVILGSDGQRIEVMPAAN